MTASRLFDGCSDTFIENGAVLIEGTKIRLVGRIADVRPPDGAEVEEHHFPTGTLLPGLIDAHTHVNFVGDGTYMEEVMSLSDDVLLMRSIASARIHLRSGVTTARECGAKNKTAFSLREGHRLGLVMSPRMVVCGRPITITGGHMWQMGAEADGVAEVRHAVRVLIKEGADWIKAPATGGSTRTSSPYRPSFSLDELRALVDEAHLFGKLVGTHCLSTAGIINSLDAGVDMIIHGQMKELDGSWKFRPDVAERIAREGVVVNPTLHIGRARLWAVQRSADEGAVAPVQYGAEQWDLARAASQSESQLEIARLLLDAGVRMIAGSDAGFGWYPMGQLWRELECFSQIGMSRPAALLSSTRDGAAAIGVSQFTGTLESAKEADLLVVEGNPADELGALAHVLAVFQGGAEVERQDSRAH